MKSFFAACLVLYAGLVLYMFLMQRSFVYVPDTSLPILPPDMEDVTFATEDGLTLSAWYHPPATKNQPTFVLFPGNAGNRGDRLNKARHFTNAGLGVLLVEYRGYGGNPGTPSEKGLYQDGRAAIKWLETQPSTPIILYGESLGTGVAVYLAASTKDKFCTLILEAPYTSLAEMAAHHYPYLPVKWLLKDKFDSLANIQNITLPLLVLHGERDQTIPVSYGKKLYQAAPMPKKLVLIKNAGHNDLYEYGAGQTVLDFFRRHGHCQKK